jgi:outer membrane protein OmpA-like peptidoglycan-associated protein
MIQDKRTEKYSLLVFDFDKSTITSSQRKILEKVKERIMPNSMVTISGYTDRTGEVDYNRDLALRRCQEIQKILNVNQTNSIMKPIGSDVLLFDNDTPQGRSYCRTVQITIETPVKD